MNALPETACMESARARNATARQQRSHRLFKERVNKCSCVCVYKLINIYCIHTSTTLELGSTRLKYYYTREKNVTGMLLPMGWMPWAWTFTVSSSCSHDSHDSRIVILIVHYRLCLWWSKSIQIQVIRVSAALLLSLVLFPQRWGLCQVARQSLSLTEPALTKIKKIWLICNANFNYHIYINQTIRDWELNNISKMRVLLLKCIRSPSLSHTVRVPAALWLFAAARFKWPCRAWRIPSWRKTKTTTDYYY